jgi:hypothetical protein
VIELWRKYIEIQIQHTVLMGDIVHIGVNLVLVLDADHLTDESRLYRREYIVPDIAREIGELVGIFWIGYRSLEIEMIIIVPEVGVFIDVYELVSWLYDSLSHCVDPVVEGVIVVVEYDHTLTELHKMLESDT